MKVGSLFAGIGGFDLGLERAGFRVVWQCELDPWCRQVLARHWPEAQQYADILETDWTAAERVDVVCGGFPCQDISPAGPRLGLRGERSGPMWRAMRGVIGELRPRWVAAENSYQGWRSWVPAVRRDLAGIGYASVCIRVRACDVGFPHRRARAFVLACLGGFGRVVGRRAWMRILAAAHAHDYWQSPRRGRQERRWAHHRPPAGDVRSERSPIRALGGSFHGIPPFVDRAEPERARRIRALGNAIVPAVAEVVGRVILEVERRLRNDP